MCEYTSTGGITPLNSSLETSMIWPATSGHWPQTPVHFSAAHTMSVTTGHKLLWLSLLLTCYQWPPATNTVQHSAAHPMPVTTPVAVLLHLWILHFRGVILWWHIIRCDHTSTCSDSMERSVTPEALFRIFGHNSFIIGPIFELFFFKCSEKRALSADLTLSAGPWTWTPKPALYRGSCVFQFCFTVRVLQRRGRTD